MWDQDLLTLRYLPAGLRHCTMVKTEFGVIQKSLELAFCGIHLPSQEVVSATHAMSATQMRVILQYDLKAIKDDADSFRISVGVCVRLTGIILLSFCVASIT